MRRHTFDPVSFVFGALFAAIGLTFLFGNADIGDLHLGAIWPLPLILIGVLMLVSTFQRRQRDEPVPPQSVPTVTATAAATVPMATATSTEIDGLDDDDTGTTPQHWSERKDDEGSDRPGREGD